LHHLLQIPKRYAHALQQWHHQRVTNDFEIIEVIVHFESGGKPMVADPHAITHAYNNNIFILFLFKLSINVVYNITQLVSYIHAPSSRFLIFITLFGTN
jgi:hypothetical protein